MLKTIKLLSILTKMLLYKNILRPALFQIDPELTWKLSDLVLSNTWLWKAVEPVFNFEDKKLNTQLSTISLENPIGLAAGYDKNCKYLPSLETFGFGYLIGGTITRHPRLGNPKPRLLRIKDKNALVNSLGFPGLGLKNCLKSLADQNMSTAKRMVSISGTEISDIKECLIRLEPYVSAIELNISSPNTKGLKIFQEFDTFKILIESLNNIRKKPLMIKMPPFPSDSSNHETENILGLCQIASDLGIEAVTISNTKPIRHIGLAIGQGGLSGPPLFKNTIGMIKKVKSHIRNSTSINACGGISTGTQAVQAIKAGATTVQLLTSLIYEGPSIVKNIKKHMAENL